MHGIIHKLKTIPNKITYYFKLLNWARTHSKEADNYKFLVELRKTAYNTKLKMEREERKDRVQKLEIQLNLIDKILKYVR